jgi:transposase
VPAKTPEQQSGLMLHRTRHLLIRQRTSVINAIRAHCAEFGLVAPVGRRGVEELLNVIANAKDAQVPAIARACVTALGAQLYRIKQQILEFDRMITAWHRCCDTSRRLDEIPSVGLQREDSPCRLGAVHTWHKADVRMMLNHVRFWG